MQVWEVQSVRQRTLDKLKRSRWKHLKSTRIWLDSKSGGKPLSSVISLLSSSSFLISSFSISIGTGRHWASPFRDHEDSRRSVTLISSHPRAGIIYTCDVINALDSISSPLVDSFRVSGMRRKAGGSCDWMFSTAHTAKKWNSDCLIVRLFLLERYRITKTPVSLLLLPVTEEENSVHVQLVDRLA